MTGFRDLIKLCRSHKIIRCPSIATVNNIQVVAKRAAAGDGNCIFRSVAFSALNEIIAKRDPYCIEQFKSLLTSAL